MKLSIVRASAMGPIIAAMRELNIPVSHLLEDANLPQPHCYSSHDWVLTERLLDLSNRVQAKAGIPSFAHFAAKAGSIGDMGEFGSYLLASSTLKEVLNRYCSKQVYYRNSANLFTMTGRNCVWFCRQTKGYFLTGHEQLELYTLSEMLKVVRLAMGPGWWPERMYFQSNTAPTFQDEAEESKTELHFDQEFGGFSIPMSLLRENLKYKHCENAPHDIDNEKDEYWDCATDDLICSLRKILPSYVRDNEVRIETVSEIVGLSVRTLQRLLAQNNLCYRELLEQVRFRAALNMLKQREFKLIDIAIELGYGHASSFTRAFHRWAGVSPHRFRQQALLEY